MMNTCIARIGLFVFVILCAASCNPPKDTGETVNLNGIILNKYVTEQIENTANKKFENFTLQLWNEDFSQVDSVVQGIAIPFVREDIARKIVLRYLNDLQQQGYYIYLKNLDFNEDFTNSFYDIAVLKCSNQFELVKLMQTCGPNYDITNDQVIEKLRTWNAESPFEIIVADGDRVEANFLTLPKNLDAFADDIYEFCPDVIDQGAGSKEELILYYQNEKSFWLWWD